MSDDTRNPTWVVEALGALNTGKSVRDILAQMLRSALVNPYAITATTAELAAIGNAVNTSDNKVAGYMVWNSTTGVPVWADGSAAADTWSGADGAVDHTPI